MLRTLVILGMAAFAGKALMKQANAGTQGGGPSKDEGASAPAQTNATAGAERREHGVGMASSGSSARTGHAPTDLSGDTHPDGSTRADEHFRPDPHAQVAPEDRESLRPATVKLA